MRKSVLVFGTISGIISAIWVCVAMNFMDHCNPENMATGMLLGYASMLVANIFLFIGVRNYRDKFNDGVITFGKALGVGLLIALVASTFYVLAWEIYYFGTDSNFMEVFRESQLKMWESSGMSEAKIAIELKNFDKFAGMYQNPLFNAAITYMEILPMGILCALITAIIVRRKTRKQPKVQTVTDTDQYPNL
jgi:hypothetical protein